MRSQQSNPDSSDNPNDDGLPPVRDISDIAYGAAVKGDITRAEKIRRKHPAVLHAIGTGIYRNGSQQDYLEKIQILTLLQHPNTTHWIIDQRIAWIQESKLYQNREWFMTNISNTAVTKAHNALSLKKAILSMTSDEAYHLVQQGSWAGFVLLANLICGHIRKKSDKSDFLPFMVWIRILEFTLGINNRQLLKCMRFEETWGYTLMARLGVFFSNTMRPKQDIDNEAAPRLPLRRGHS